MLVAHGMLCTCSFQLNWSKQDEHLLHHRRTSRNNCSRWLFRTARLNEGDLPRPVLTFLKIVTIPVARDIAWPAKVALAGLEAWLNGRALK